jgi:hypothetical protein
MVGVGTRIVPCFYLRGFYVIKYLYLVAAGATITAATPAVAQERTSRVTAGATGGTLGVGPEVALRISPVLGVRANATFLGVSHSVDSDDITYDGRLKLGSIGLMADLHPFRGGFRVSAGFRINSNKVDLKADTSQDATVEVGDTPYSGAAVGSLGGTVKTRKFAPMLTVGYASGLTPGLKFGVEAGAMLQGSPRIDNLRASGPIAADPAFQAALAREEQEIEDDIDNYRIYPILQVSLRYAF